MRKKTPKTTCSKQPFLSNWSSSLDSFYIIIHTMYNSQNKLQIDINRQIVNNCEVNAKWFSYTILNKKKCNVNSSSSFLNYTINIPNIIMHLQPFAIFSTTISFSFFKTWLRNGKTLVTVPRNIFLLLITIYATPL